MIYSTKRILHINSKMWRIVLASVFAGISTAAVFLPFYTKLFSVIYRFLISILIILIAFGYQGIHKFIVRNLTYIGLSMLMCASVLTIELLWNPAGCAIYNDVVYFDISPTVLIITTIITHIILSIYQTISQKHKLSCKVRTVEISINENNQLRFESAVDTGCTLKEPFSGLPVIMLEKEIIGNAQIPKKEMRVIPYTTAAGSDIIMGFKPKQVYIDGKKLHSNCYIGICHNKLNGEIKSIMGNDISEGI